MKHPHNFSMIILTIWYVFGKLFLQTSSLRKVYFQTFELSFASHNLANYVQ